MSPLVILLFGVLFFLGFVLGALVFGKHDPAKLSKAERRELGAQRRLIGELTVLAAEHTGFVDPFAILVLDKITEHNKEIS